MERWILIGGVIAIFLGLAVMGWYFQPHDTAAHVCASAEAHCGGERF